MTHYNAAIEVSQILSQAFPLIEGICLYGSVARGDDTQDSDIDILVFGRDPSVTVRQLRKHLPQHVLSHRISLSYVLLNKTGDRPISSLIFLGHLSREGRILFDRRGKLQQLINENSGTRPDADDELSLHLARLECLEDITQFNNNFLLCFSEIYAIVTSIIFLLLVRNNIPEFNRDRAFASIRLLHPKLSADVDRIEALKPFYLQATRGVADNLPFSYHGSGSRVPILLNSARRIAKS